VSVFVSNLFLFVVVQVFLFFGWFVFGLLF